MSAAQPQPDNPADPAKGEMLVQLIVQGIDTRRADALSIGCLLEAKGAKAADARQALDSAEAKLRSAVLASGLTNARLVSFKDAGKLNLPSNIAFLPQDDVRRDEGSDSYRADRDLTLLLDTKVQVDQATDLLMENGCDNSQLFSWPMLDKSAPAAQTAAVQSALANAQKEAERIAAAQGMTSARLVRIQNSNPIAPMLGNLSLEMLIGLYFGTSQINGFPQTDIVETKVTLGVDFILAPAQNQLR